MTGPSGSQGEGIRWYGLALFASFLSCESIVAEREVMVQSCDESQIRAKGLWSDMISVQIQAQRAKSRVTAVTKADYGPHAT